METKLLNQASGRTAAITASLVAAIALLAMIIVATPSEAASGGVGLGLVGNTGNNTGNNNANGKCKKANLGKRTLKKGSCGQDVLTLHWFLRAKKLDSASGKVFADRTERAVIDFQQDANLEPTGVVNKATVAAVKKTMSKGKASWYGPGFFGNRTACGKKLKKKTIGVAVPVEKAKKFPCGTKVLLNYKGRWVRARVIDTGGFGKYGRKWDLTSHTAKLLNKNWKSDGVFTVRAAVQK